MLLQPPGGRCVAQPISRGAAQLLARRPQWDLALRGGVIRPQDRAVVGRHGGGVGQDDQRRLQPLGAVHRHDPHQPARLLSLPLHLGGGAAQPVQEPLQRGRVGAAIGQSGVQQLVHRLGRLRTKPGKQPCPPAERPHPRQQRREEVGGGTPVGAFGSARVKPVPQRAGTADRQRHQAVIGQAAQRAGQEAGEGQVVLRQQQRIGQRHQVLHRRLLGQHQPVEARHRHATQFQRPHQLPRELVAPADQHQDVAGRQRTPLAFQQHAARGLLPDPAGQRVGEMLGRRAQALVVVRHLPGWRRVVGVGQRRQRPQLDRAGVVGTVGVVGERLPRSHHALGGLRIGEHRVHQGRRSLAAGSVRQRHVVVE